MRSIIALIEPSAVPSVREALIEAGAQGLTISEALGIGHSGRVFHRERADLLAPMIRIEVLAEADHVPMLLDAILSTFPQKALSERGKIFVVAIEEIIRIRTQEINSAALL